MQQLQPNALTLSKVVSTLSTKTLLLEQNGVYFHRGGPTVTCISCVCVCLFLLHLHGSGTALHDWPCLVSPGCWWFAAVEAQFTYGHLIIQITHRCLEPGGRDEHQRERRRGGMIDEDLMALSVS